MIIIDASVAETLRTVLRRPEPNDLDAVYRIHSDPETNKFNPAGPDPDPPPVLARTKPANTPSQRTALKAGLTRRADLDRDDGTGMAVIFVSSWPT